MEIKLIKFEMRSESQYLQYDFVNGRLMGNIAVWHYPADEADRRSVKKCIQLNTFRDLIRFCYINYPSPRLKKTQEAYY